MRVDAHEIREDRGRPALGCILGEEHRKDALLSPDGGPSRQRRLAEQHGLVGLVADLAADFSDGITRAERDTVV